MTSAQKNSTGSLHGTSETKLQQLKELSKEEFGHVSGRLAQLLDDIFDLYAGKWETHQACQVGYHTLTHALDVALATGRMIAGWNRQHDNKIDENLFLYGIAASLFHDAGYIKEKEDGDGSGGKFTFSHVPRSMQLARTYLAANGWPAEGSRIITDMIGITEFNESPEWEGKFTEQRVEAVASMVATADLIAQMSDVNYLEHIKDLFQEFQEAYRKEGKKNLKNRGVHIFNSVSEIIDGTPSFYRNFVLPRLAQMGGMSRYLIAYYGEGRNPYLESIAANLGGETGGHYLRWRRIGEILTELGAVTEEQIQAALSMQKNNFVPKDKDSGITKEVKDRALSWIHQQLQGDFLGNILVQSRHLSPSVLRKGVIAQILPTDFTMRLNSRELLLLLHSMILLQNIQNGSWIFNQLLEIINELLDCQSSSILLADRSERFLDVAYASGSANDETNNKSFAIDKGLPGWVYLHGKPATIKRGEIEEDSPEITSDKQDDSNRLRTMLAIPLNVSGKRIGVIEVLNKKEGNFTDHDMNLLSLAGNLLSQSLSAALWL